MPNDNGGTRSRSGGMSVSLASPDGRVVGGGVAGLLVAASPVQVWLLCFFSRISDSLPLCSIISVKFLSKSELWERSCHCLCKNRS